MNLNDLINGKISCFESKNVYILVTESNIAKFKNSLSSSNQIKIILEDEIFYIFISSYSKGFFQPLQNKIWVFTKTHIIEYDTNNSNKHQEFNLMKIADLASVRLIKEADDWRRKNAFGGNTLIASPDFSPTNVLLGATLERIYNEFASELSMHELAFLSLDKNIYPIGNLFSARNSDNTAVILDKILDKIQKREISISSINNFEIDEHTLDFIHEASIDELNKILVEHGFNDFGNVDVTRTTNNRIKTGNYIYQISPDKTLTLMENPLVLHIDENGTAKYIFDANKYTKSINNIIKIKENEVKDFQLFGNELMINDVRSLNNNELKGSIDSPKILGTSFNEILFGSAYATLKGMSMMLSQLNQTIAANKITIETISKIEDTRVIQLIFNDHTDIEFKGISIYYDFNRKMGNVKNKESENDNKVKTSISLKENPNNTGTQLKQYKEMLEQGLIDENEFNILKKKLLGL